MALRKPRSSATTPNRNARGRAPNFLFGLPTSQIVGSLILFICLPFFIFYFSSLNDASMKEIERSRINVEKLVALSDRISNLNKRANSCLPRVALLTRKNSPPKPRLKRYNKRSSFRIEFNISSTIEDELNANKTRTAAFLKTLHEEFIKLGNSARDVTVQIDTALDRHSQMRQKSKKVSNRHRIYHNYNRSAYVYRQVKDPIIDNLTYYIPQGNKSHHYLYNLSQVEQFAWKAMASKGHVVKYNFTYSPVHTVSGGSYFVYDHSHYNNSCMTHYLSLKYDTKCGDANLKPTYIRQLLVVAVQRSGTHYLWEMLNRLGIHVHHEGVGPDGAIGWLYAVNAFTGSGPNVGAFLRRGYVINNPVKLTKHRFHHVMHQVRHPLRVIGTLITRCEKWDKYWMWISMVKGMELFNARQTPLRRAMLLYILWNKHIERYADIRFRSETTSPRDVCMFAKFHIELCSGLSERNIVEPASVIHEEPLFGLATGSEGEGVDMEGEEGEEEEEEDGESEGEGEEEGGEEGEEEEGEEESKQDIEGEKFGEQKINNQHRSTSKNLISRKMKLDPFHQDFLRERKKIEQEERREREARNVRSRRRQQLGNQHLRASRRRLLSPPEGKNNSTSSSSSSSSSSESESRQVTWDELAKEDIELTNEIMIMCLEYGYTLDPNLMPQSKLSKQFTA